MSFETLNRRVPLILLLLSVGLNVGLSRRIVALQAPPARMLQPGVRVPALDVRTLSGQSVRITYEGRLPTLIYYFSPTCGWCERNWDNVRALQEASAGRFKLIGLSPTANGVEKVLRDHDASFEVYTGLSPDAARAYHFTGTPETVLVSTIGTVLRAWPGAYGPSSAPAMEKYFGITLPGLTSTGPN